MRGTAISSKTGQTYECMSETGTRSTQEKDGDLLGSVLERQRGRGEGECRYLEVSNLAEREVRCKTMSLVCELKTEGSPSDSRRRSCH